MPRRADIESILLIGSGPIVIGQACEFDYAGCQALKVLREDGFRTIVVNSNPATIMTDPGFADRTYLEPLDLEGVAAVLERERPDALLPTMGGQTALNLARELAEAGVLSRLGIELIGAPLDVIARAEDRRLFKRAVESAGLRVPRSRGAHVADRAPGDRGAGGRAPGVHARRARRRLRRRPKRSCARRSSTGCGRARSARCWWRSRCAVGTSSSSRSCVTGPTTSSIVCSIENLDPMGVHTGDSVTVAPQMTLSDEAYQELRDAAAAVIRAVGVECGGSNIQFARDRESGELRVIEMNPRVSRSSALASKATGYPIAKVAAKLAVGYTLDEIPNDLTKTTPASFEPTLDYVVVKFPRFAFEKFPGADRRLGIQMKSVGETMGIGRTFQEAFMKAMRSRELETPAAGPWQTLTDVPEDLHPFFQREIAAIRHAVRSIGSLDALDDDAWLELKRLGLSDAEIAAATGGEEKDARALRESRGVRPAFRRVDSCAGEVEASSNYYYSTWGEADEAPPSGPKPRVVILGSGPNRIGQGIEFDYCCVHAADAFRSLGYEAIMVNCNPETVSTDYDTSRPPLLRAARRGVGHPRARARAPRGRRDPVRRPDAVEARCRNRGGRVPHPRNRPRRDRSLREPGALRSRRAAARPSLPRVGHREHGGRGTRRRRRCRLPGARSAVLRARGTRDARLPHRRRAPRDAPRHDRVRARRPLPRRSCRGGCRRGLRRKRRVHRRRHAARRGGGHPLRGFDVHSARTGSRRADARGDRQTRCASSGRRSARSAC